MEDKQLDYCLHTHTKRCGHAFGADEEYVQAAIDAGIKVLGFSDHIFLPNIFHPHMRGDFSMLDEYIDSLSKLKEKYRTQIEIHIGFEAEYLIGLEDVLSSIHSYPGIEYFILGQHCFYDANTKDTASYFYDHSARMKEEITHYRDDLIKGMKSGLFRYVCHPDLFMCVYPKFDDFAYGIAQTIIEAAIECDIPLELNFGGPRVGARKYGNQIRFRYPVIEFWKMVADSKAKVVIGVDAHSPNDFKLEKSYEELRDFFALDLNYVHPTVR